MSIYITVKKSKFALKELWSASMVTFKENGDKSNEASIGESILYPTPAEAWDSIREHVKKLDFGVVEI